MDIRYERILRTVFMSLMTLPSRLSDLNSIATLLPKCGCQSKMSQHFKLLGFCLRPTKKIDGYLVFPIHSGPTETVRALARRYRRY